MLPTGKFRIYGLRKGVMQMGCNYYERVSSNRATVRDLIAVCRIRNRYDHNLEIAAEPDLATGTYVLRISDADERWPLAVREDVFHVDERLDEEAYCEARDKVLEQHGDEGFVAFLLEVAPYVTSTLTVQATAVGSGGEFFGAKEWTVKPGSKGVDIKEIRPLEDTEESVAAQNTSLASRPC